MRQPAFEWTRPGHWLYQLWHRPRAAVARSVREGGPVAQWKTHRARQAMRMAAAALPTLPVRSPGEGDACLVFLTGARYWEQTAFCLRSFQIHAPDRLWPVLLVDDGTLSPAMTRRLASAFPGLHIVSGTPLQQALDARLPSGRFPTLREHRMRFTLLRKLTDVHAARPGANLVLDADMLFHRRPDALIDWLGDPSLPIVMTDFKESNGYGRARLSTLVTGPIPTLVNTGVCGMSSSAMDWDNLERWTRTLLSTHGSSYFLEQALTALLLSGTPHRQLPPADYIVAPNTDEILQPKACLHHYVDLAKRGYFRHAWRGFAGWSPARMGAPS